MTAPGQPRPSQPSFDCQLSYRSAAEPQAPDRMIANRRDWHEPSVPATAGVGPEVGVELPMVHARRADLQQGKVDRPFGTRRLTGEDDPTLTFASWTPSPLRQ
jgi:hypothetical protein